MKKLIFFTMVMLALSCNQAPSASNEIADPEALKVIELTNRFFDEALNGGKTELLDELLHPSFKSYHYPTPPGSDKAGFIQGMKDILAAFPDIKMVVYDQFGEGDRVFTYFSWTGTHKGTFQGIAATNKQIKVEGMDIWREQDGKLIENWVIMDGLGLLTQLGVIPPPPTPTDGK